MTIHPDRRPGDDWSLRDLYEFVPDAYELDLMEEARHPAPTVEPDLDLEPARRAAIAELGYDATESDEDDAAPSPTQARFMVERLLGGEILDDPRS